MQSFLFEMINHVKLQTGTFSNQSHPCYRDMILLSLELGMVAVEGDVQVKLTETDNWVPS
jgi:uncharacterized membrane protein